MLSRSLAFLFALALAAGCSPDPYDPPIGPRNPRPGAERFLSATSDIPPSEKLCLLEIRPCSAHTLEKLAEAPSREIRSLVAANPSTPAATLEKLMTDKEAGVRQTLASNPKTPQHILSTLDADGDENVRWQLAHRQAAQR